MEVVCSPEATERVAIELPLEPESAQRVRIAIAPFQYHVEVSSFDELRLLVSELVSDALATEPAPTDGTISLRAEVVDGFTRVVIAFNGLAMRIRARKPELGDPGWGVYLVQRLATRWGTRYDDGSTSVWFEMPSRGLQVTTP